MIDEILAAGATFDWISPIASLLQDVINGPACGFGISTDIPYSARDIQRLLTQKGIKVWGLAIVDNVIIFRVPKGQAGWANHILEQAMVPILYAPAEAYRPSKRQPKNDKGSTDPLDWLFNSLDEVGQFLFK